MVPRWQKVTQLHPTQVLTESMKDRQTVRKPETTRIPIVSPALHVISIPFLMILRQDFGYRFLSPKSIFLTLGWAMLLFGIYSWFDPGRWNRSFYLYSFLSVSAGLYGLHLFRALKKQWSDAPHDQYGGKSWFALFGMKDEVIAQWIEPVLVLLTGITLKVFTEQTFSELLIVGAVALFLKELINQWGRIRKVKTQTDATEDAEEIMGKVSDQKDAAPKRSIKRKANTSRKQRSKRPRSRHNEVNPTVEIELHAATLRMLRTYSLKQANDNYRQLVKQFHADEDNLSTDQNDSLAKLNRAIEFYRSDFNGGNQN